MSQVGNHLLRPVIDRFPVQNWEDGLFLGIRTVNVGCVIGFGGEEMLRLRGRVAEAARGVVRVHRRGGPRSVGRLVSVAVPRGVGTTWSVQFFRVPRGMGRPGFRRRLTWPRRVGRYSRWLFRRSGSARRPGSWWAEGLFRGFGSCGRGSGRRCTRCRRCRRRSCRRRGWRCHCPGVASDGGGDEGFHGAGYFGQWIVRHEDTWGGNFGRSSANSSGQGAVNDFISDFIAKGRGCRC